MSDLLATLDERQTEAARTLRGPLVVLAGAGSGKTTTVAHRIAYGVDSGVFDPRRTMALTFTTRAAGELAQRLGSLGTSGVAVRTFHSAALRQLRFFWGEACGGAPPRIQASKTPLAKAALAACGISASDAVARDTADEVEWTKAVGVMPDDYAGEADRAGRPRIEGVDRALMSRVLAAYEEEKTAKSVIDFEDVLLITIGLLKTQGRIRDEVRRTYRWYTVDEYQDVSPLQQRLLDLWLGDRDDLCVVGDPAQTIYRFAGADQSLLTGFRDRFPQATTVELTCSYRCSRPVLDVANRLAARIPGALRLTTGRVDGDSTASTRTMEFPDDLGEARGVAEEISALIANGTDPADIACLYRMNAQSAVLAEALVEAGVPFAIRASERFFGRAEVKEALTRLRGEARAAPNLPATQALTTVLAIMGHSDEPPRGLGLPRDRWESLAALRRFASQSPAGLGVKDLVATLDRRAADRAAPKPAGVTLSSLHAAKGMEWETVFIVGAAEGLLPISRADDHDDVLDERRLFYVGATRARDRLIVTWARARPGGGTVRSPSRFLAAIDSSPTSPRGSADPPVRADPRPVVVAERPPARGGAPARCRVCSRALVTGQERVLGRCRGCPSRADSAVVERLRTWRERRSREGRVPEFAVLTDAALERLAETSPGTPEELIEVPGMTNRKLLDFGPALLEVLHGSKPGPATTGPGRSPEAGGPVRLE